MKQNILIVTVYNSENCGSFLQAYALKKYLENIGCNVFFYIRKHRGTSHDLRMHFIYFLKCVLKGNFITGILWLKKWFVFEKYVREFHVIRHFELPRYNINTIILGSDTIWNFDSLYFESNSIVFLGKIFPHHNIISYAASVANTSTTKFSEVVHNAGGINLCHYLVRDKHTRDCLCTQSIKNVSLVCDPTLLMDEASYSKLLFRIPVKENYIVLYYFGQIKEDLRDCLIEFARNNKLKIISLLKKREWCDYSTEVNPGLMISYYKNASYVLTNTFHGCAFAINFNIPFAVYDEHKIKVNELLETYKCKDRLFSRPSEIQIIFNKSLDVTEVVEMIRKESKRLLLEALLNK